MNGWVQLPRLYNVYKEQGIIENFEQLLDNIFHPLFEVTRDPNSHPQLHLFLKNVSSALCLSRTAALSHVTSVDGLAHLWHHHNIVCCQGDLCPAFVMPCLLQPLHEIATEQKL